MQNKVQQGQVGQIKAQQAQKEPQKPKTLSQALNLSEIKTSRDVISAMMTLTQFIDEIREDINEKHLIFAAKNEKNYREMELVLEVFQKIGGTIQGKVRIANDEAQKNLIEKITKTHADLQKEVEIAGLVAIEKLRNETEKVKAHDSKLEQALISAENRLMNTIGAIQSIQKNTLKNLNFGYMLGSLSAGALVGMLFTMGIFIFSEKGDRILSGIKAIRAEGNELLALSQRIDENLFFEKTMRKFNIEIIPVVVGKTQEVALKIPEKHLPLRENVLIDKGYGIIPLK
ncbi:hypothetical protein [Campylobacter sp. RM16189]|uniref:hypothetical protein n=1 Tax=Campylobacter sp. RM16189 TaxID=1705726 RepID=UPI0014731624|nr:hypothetical protein [Campylobacter sp. RM16189]